jgi:hypothetical protein
MDIADMLKKLYMLTTDSHMSHMTDMYFSHDDAP